MLSPHPDATDEKHYVLQPEILGQHFTFDAFLAGAALPSPVDAISALSHISFLVATKPNFVKPNANKDHIYDSDLESHDDDPFTTLGWTAEPASESGLYVEQDTFDSSEYPTTPERAPSGGLLLGCSG